LDIGESKASVVEDIDARYQQLGELSQKIHANPEVAFHESKAAAWLAEYLEENGFSVERGICELPTAFRGSYGVGKPVIAFLAEYDALPKLGHACGHNLIATCAVGAGVASKRVVDRFGGSIMVIGTPGEELYGGKVIMAERGAFDDVDIAMMVHPGGENIATMRTLACQTLDVEFLGKAAHAAARPEAGINALEAMIQSFNAINSLRQHISDKARIHGIITDGGEAPNIVPAHTAASFIVRAEDDSYLDGGERYAAMLNNLPLARLFRQNIKSLGQDMCLGDASLRSFSTDVGNVSRLVPAIQPLVAIAPADILIHSPGFAHAAASEDGLRCLLGAAKAMAMTLVDVLADPETFAGVQEEFRKGK